MKLLTALACSLACPFLVGQSPSLLSKAPGLTPMELMKLSSVRSVMVSPDKETIAFTRSVPRVPTEGAGGARSHLFVLEGGKERELIGGIRSVRGAAFHPDGSSMTFIARGRGVSHNEVYSMSLDSGETRRVTTTPHGVSSYSWRPDGRAIAYTITDEAPSARSQARSRGFQQKVVDEEFNHISMWLWDAQSGESKRLTKGQTVFNFEWSPDGKRLVAGIAPRNSVDASYMFTKLHLVDPKTGKVELLIDTPGKLGDYAWSPDSKRIAYLSAVDRRDPSAGTVFVVDLSSRKARCLTPDTKGMFHHLEWVDTGRIATAVSFGTRAVVRVIRVRDGSLGPLWPSASKKEPELAVRSFALTKHGFAAPASSPAHPSEVFEFRRAKPYRMTNSNPWLDNVQLGKQEVLSWSARDGMNIEGLLIYPVEFKQGVRYPVVIIAHGGPESHFSHGWNTSYSRPGQCLSARGYFSFYPNYRGSTGRGVDFAKADHGDIMGAEFQDLLDGLAELDRRKLIDLKRVGINGGSYGGFMAAWAATKQTKHFAAAVSFVPVTDIRTKTYTTDIPWESYLVHQQEQWPHEHPGEVRDRSPLTWAEHCRTPLLLAGGTSDTRVHPSQPHMLYRAIKFATKTPVRYVQYPGEGHGNRTNTNQYDLCLRSLRWLDQYLAPGDHRNDPLPSLDLDYGDWISGRK